MMLETAILWGGLALAIALGLYSLHRLALWLEARGHLFYMKRRPESGFRNVLDPLHEAFRPSVKHVYEVKDQKRKEQKEPGDGSEE
jgi:hypothetical protein